MIDLAVDMTKANAVLREYCEALGIVNHGSVGAEGRAFVKRQCALLTDALIKQTPGDRKKTGKAIEKNILAKFAAVKNPRRHFQGARGKRNGSYDVDWYHFTSDAIYGVAEDEDLRDASEDELYRLQFRISAKPGNEGRIRVGKRGVQTVWLWKRIVAKEATIKKVIARLKSHIGRLKAAWLPARDATGGRRVAQWIEDHNVKGKVRGGVMDNLITPALPSITLVNKAKGARGAEYGAHLALMSRIGAMKNDMRLMLKGVKARTDILAGRR